MSEFIYSAILPTNGILKLDTSKDDLIKYVVKTVIDSYGITEHRVKVDKLGYNSLVTINILGQSENVNFWITRVPLSSINL